MTDLASLLADIEALGAPEPLSTTDQVVGAARSYASGPMLNFNDETEAVLQSLFSGFQKPYSEALSEIDAEQNAYAAANPITNAAISIPASFLNPMNRAAGLLSKGGPVAKTASRVLFNPVNQAFVAGAGAAQEGETRLGQGAKSAVIGLGVSAGSNVVGNTLKDIGKQADRLKLSAFGIKNADIARQIKGMSDDGVASLGGGTVPIVTTLDKLERRGVIAAGDDILDNLQNIHKAQDGLGGEISKVLDDADKVIAPVKDFDLANTNKFILSKTGDARNKAEMAAATEYEALMGQIGNGTLQDLQRLKVGLNYKFDQNPYVEDVVKALRSDLRAEIEKRINSASTQGLLPTSFFGKIKGLNKDYGELAGMFDAFKGGVASKYGGNIVQDAMQQLRTSGGTGSLNITSAVTGNPVWSMLGTALNAANSKQGLNALADAGRSFPGVFKGLGTAISEVGTARAGAQAQIDLKETPKPSIKAETVRSLLAEIEGLSTSDPSTQGQSQAPAESSKGGQQLQNRSGAGLLGERSSAAGMQGSQSYDNLQPNSGATQAPSLFKPISTSGGMSLFDESPELFSLGDDMDDKPKDVAQVEQAIDADPYYSALYEAESGRNPQAKNPTSTASGGFQFLKGTAKSLGLKNAMDLGESFDKVQTLTDSHREVFGDDPLLLYSAHYLGQTVLTKLLSGAKLSDKEKKQVEYLKVKALPRFEKIYQKVLAKQSGSIET